MAKKMEEMEVHRKQEEETRKLRWLQQERKSGDTKSFCKRRGRKRRSCIRWPRPRG